MKIYPLLVMSPINQAKKTEYTHIHVNIYTHTYMHTYKNIYTFSVKSS